MSTKDFWLTRRPVVRTDKIRQVMTLEAGTYDCGPALRSLGFYGTTAGETKATPYPAAFNITNNLTVELWFKPLNSSGQYDKYLIGQNTATAGNNRWYLYIPAMGNVTFTYINTTPAAVSIDIGYPVYGAWNHVAVVYNATEVKTYLNGELKNTTVTGLSLRAGAGLGEINLANIGNGGGNLFEGYMGDVRIWNVSRTYDEIINSYQTRRSNTETGLVGYWTFQDTIASLVAANTVAANPLTFVIPSGNTIVSDVYPPLIYGASFVVAKWPVTLTEQTSLIWPVEMPDDTTGMLCVSWTDADGVFQRRKLWDMDSVDIQPAPALYAGERLAATFMLELWNIDGQATCVLGADVDISVALCTAPTTSYDHDQQTITTPVVDSTLAEPFPLTPFPLEFNTQQTY